MAKYAVELVQRVFEETTVMVEATTPEQAQQKALEIAGDADWDFMEMDSSYDRNVVSVVRQ